MTSDDLRLSRLARALSLGGIVVLGACTTPPNKESPSHRPDGTTPKSASAKPAQTTLVKPASPAQLPAMPTAQELQKAVLASIEYLEAGQEEQAEAELQKVVQIDPNNRLAQGLLKQIHDDPIVSLGATSFPYRVPAGESLSRVAQRFLNDPLMFYMLARYNNIKVPRTLGEGQVIRVPGRAPAMVAALPPPRESAPVLRESPAMVTVAAAPSAPPPVPVQQAAAAADEAPAAESVGIRSARIVKQKSEAVARHTRSARSAFAKQDLQGALLGWDAVLAIESDNRTALLERQRVLSLMEKLGKVK